jgi:hypothetical protein
MSRSHANQSSPVLPIAVLLLTVTTLAPTGLTSWLTAFRGPMMAFVAPISHPGTWLSQRLRPAVEIETPLDRATKAQLEAQLRELAQLHANAVRRNADLLERIRQLQSGVPFESPSAYKKVLASRTGYDARSGLIELRSGSLKGVEIASVVVDGATMQIVGKVTTVGPTTCSVRPITDRRITPGSIESIILNDEPVTPESLAGAQRLALEPTGSGTLAGDLPIDPYGEPRVSAGMIVRLDDSGWPDAARMLVLGRVTDVNRTDNPRFVRVIVTPERVPTRLQDMVIRIATSPTESGGGG